jgi:hypothetical protein
MALATFDPDKGRPQSDEDRVQVRDLVGSVLLVKVNKHERDVRTKFKPEGTDCLDVDIASVMTGKVASNQRIWNGAIVDGLAPYVGQTVPVKFDWSKGQSGYQYIIPVQLTNEEQQQAEKFSEDNDPFGEKDGSAPPWAGVDGPKDEAAATPVQEAARW